jgi:hypothetical protein
LLPYGIIIAVLVGSVVFVAVCVWVGVADGIDVAVINRIPLLAADVATIGSMLLPYGTINGMFVVVPATDVRVTVFVVVVGVRVAVLVVVAVDVAVGVFVADAVVVGVFVTVGVLVGVYV